MMNNTTLSNQIEMSSANYAQGYRRGGKIKLVPAHMAPHEMDILDHLQGGKEINKKTGMRCYSHLEDLMSNPHLRNKILSHAKQKFAEGGAIHEMGDMHDEATGGGEKDKLQRLLDLLLHKKMTSPQELTREELEFLAANGEHGDREIAGIGPRTHHLFDQIAGHKTHNPRTGLPEYWSISSALSSLGHVLKGGLAGAGASAARHLGEYGAQRLGGIGGALAQRAGQGLASKFRGMEGHDTARMAGSRLADMGMRYLSGKFSGFGGASREAAQPRTHAEAWGPAATRPGYARIPAAPVDSGVGAKFQSRPALPYAGQHQAGNSEWNHADYAARKQAEGQHIQSDFDAASPADNRAAAEAQKAAFRARRGAQQGPGQGPVVEGLRTHTPVQNTFDQHGRIPVVPDAGAIIPKQQLALPAPQF